jgi:alpha-tubulin suppressor-like RCC1 family protein
MPPAPPLELTLRHETHAFEGQCLAVELTLQTELAVVLNSTLSGEPAPLSADASCATLGDQVTLEPGVQTIYLRMPTPRLGASETLTLRFEDENGSAQESELVTLARVRRMHVGGTFACAQLTTGAVQCWGDNSRGQLGTGIASFGEYSPAPKAAPLLADAEQIVLGNTFGCKLQAGQVSCWGMLTEDLRWSHLQPISGIAGTTTYIAAGFDHACALNSSGRVFCWGSNSAGQAQPMEATAELAAAREVILPAPATQLSLGRTVSCAVLNNQQLWCWGSSLEGLIAGTSPTTGPTAPTQVLLPTDESIQELGVGYSLACVRTANQVVCWGAGSAPAALSLPFMPESLAVGDEHACASQGTNARCWGRNEYGQLGSADVAESAVPLVVSGLPSEGRIESLAAGDHGTCVSVDGVPYCWGDNQLGQVGIGDLRLRPQTTPHRVASAPANIAQVALTSAFTDSQTCVLASGQVHCMGSNRLGQLGRGSFSDVTPELAPVVGLPAGIEEVSVGYGFACARTSSEVWCWGANDGGQLGNEMPGSQVHPARVMGLPSVRLLSLTAGNRHVCVGTENGAYCWGWDTLGQLGDGPAHDRTQSSTPVAVQGLTGRISRISAGNDFTCAILQEGVRCWGLSAEGILGNGVFGAYDWQDTTRWEFSNTPVSVLGLEPGARACVVDLRTNIHGACALTRAGQVLCWGFQEIRGTPSGTAYQARPVQPTGMESGVMALAAGGSQVCALKAQGLFCWGANNRGQLGTGDIESHAEPVQVQGLVGTVRLFATGNVSYRGSTCAVDQEGLKCWGDNTFRQIGIEVPAFETHPLPLAPWQQEE